MKISQWELNAETRKMLNALETRMNKSRLSWVLRLIGWEVGESFLNQSNFVLILIFLCLRKMAGREQIWILSVQEVNKAAFTIFHCKHSTVRINWYMNTWHIEFLMNLQTRKIPFSFPRPLEQAKFGDVISDWNFVSQSTKGFKIPLERSEGFSCVL